MREFERGRLQIRHCESTVAFAGNPDDEEQRVNKKFQLPLKQRIYELFCIQFGIQKDPAYDYAANYETWVIYSYASRPVKARLKAIQGLTLKRTDDLIAEEVIESLANWGEERRTGLGTQPTMPQDKWLLQMLDYLVARSDYRWGMRGRVEKFSLARNT